MGHYFYAGWCYWGGIIIEFAGDVGMCRYLGMEAALSQHVECNCCLLQHSFPQLKWKTSVDSAQTGKEVVLEGLDRPFCMVLAM
eukprot:scaffold18508_cov37-Attheya_sp.AAC.5